MAQGWGGSPRAHTVSDKQWALSQQLMNKQSTRTFGLLTLGAAGTHAVGMDVAGHGSHH